MIKVNLLYDQSVQAAAGAQESVGIDIGRLKELLNVGPGASGNIIFVVVMLVVPLGVLTSWEQWNLHSLRARKSKAEAKVKEVNAKLEKEKKVLDSLKEFESKSQAHKAKIDFVRDLSRQRLTEIKALDTLQDIIPAQVWLKSFNCSGGKFRMNGVALSEERLHEFVGKLDNAPLFQGVLLEFFDRSDSGKEQRTSFRIKGHIAEPVKAKNKAV